MGYVVFMTQNEASLALSVLHRRLFESTVKAVNVSIQRVFFNY